MQILLTTWKGLAAFVLADRTQVTPNEALDVLERVIARHLSDYLTATAVLEHLAEAEAEIRTGREAAGT